MNLWVLLAGQVALLLVSAAGFLALGWFMVRALRKMRRFIAHAENILFAVKEYNQLGHEAHKDARRVLTKVETVADQAPTVEQMVKEVVAAVPAPTADAVVEKMKADGADSGVLKRGEQ